MTARQMELFGGWGRREIPAGEGPAGSQRENQGAQTPSTPVADSCTRDDPRQDRDHSSPVGQGPVQTTGLAQALGNTPNSYDYDFSEPDPRCEPRPDWTPPEWLRLPTDPPP